MPFKSEFTKIYNDLVVPSLTSEGYEVFRADSFVDQQNILKHVIPNIFRADLIIAELTSLNPNVLYELGIAHTFAKPTVLLTQDIDNLPFDLRSYYAIPYSTHYDDASNLQKRLREIARKRRENTISFGNPVTDFVPWYYQTDPGNATHSPSGLGIKPSNLADEDNIARELRTTEQPIEETPGFLDFEVEAVSALNELNERANRMLNLTNEFGKNMNIRNRELLEPESMVLEHRLQIVKAATTDIMRFAEGIEAELPGFRAAWDRMFTNFTNLFHAASIQSNEDIEASKSFRSKMVDLRTGIDQGLVGIRALHQSVRKAKEANLQMDLSRALRRAEDNLGRLIAEFVIGDAHTVRTINLIDDILEQNR